MVECGCLDDTKKAIVAQVLDTYLQVIEDTVMKKHVETIKQEIQNCSCKVKRTKSSDNGNGEKEKREPSEYNKHTSVCMKSGKSMKDCAIEWQEKKKK